MSAPLFHMAAAAPTPADRLPARTCVGVTGLARDALVEIDFFAKRAQTVGSEMPNPDKEPPRS